MSAFVCLLIPLATDCSWMNPNCEVSKETRVDLYMTLLGPLMLLQSSCFVTYVIWDIFMKKELCSIFFKSLRAGSEALPLPVNTHASAEAWGMGGRSMVVQILGKPLINYSCGS